MYCSLPYILQKLSDLPRLMKVTASINSLLPINHVYFFRCPRCKNCIYLVIKIRHNTVVTPIMHSQSPLLCSHNLLNCSFMDPTVSYLIIFVGCHSKILCILLLYYHLRHYLLLKIHNLLRVIADSSS